MNHKVLFTKAVAMLSMMGLAATPGLSRAAGVDFYAGADLVQMTTDVDPDGLVDALTFRTQHLRLKGGVNVTKWLAVEAQLLSGADDTATEDFGSGKYGTGTTLGLFAKPHVTFRRVDLYGLLGYARAEATIDCVLSCPPVFEATLDGLAYGFGVQFLVTKKLKISLDYTAYHDGSATFNDGTITATPDVWTTGFGLGVNYRF